MDKWESIKKKQVDEMLELLYPLENTEKSVVSFRKGRGKKLFLVGAVFLLLFILYVSASKGNQQLSKENRILRPKSGSTNIVLRVSDGEHSAKIAVKVNPRRLAGEELEEALQDAALLLAERVKGKNASLLAVTEDLNLVEEIPEYGVAVIWDASGCPWVRSDGSVQNRDLAEPKEAVLRARLMYGERSIEREFGLCILPHSYTGAELFENEVLELLEEMAEKTAGEEYLQLPEESSKGKIDWEEAGGVDTIFLAAVGLVALVLVYARETAQLQQKMKEREGQLLNDYPEFLSKFLLLLGAGMNVRSAWERMAGDYKKNGKKRPVYDEMVRAMTQIEIGMPENQAYEQFGRRCGLLPYLRFTTILNQNLKKGSKNIVGLLQMEANEAFSERKEQARRKGEEAGTRLLLPMGGMLLIVLVIILVPAFASFY